MTSTEGYKIVSLTPGFVKDHIADFIAIAADIPKEAWTLENYLYELPGKWELSIAALDTKTEQLAGFIIASDKAEAIHIHKYATHPRLRSKGIGVLLLKALESKVKTNGNSRMLSLFVDKQNERARQFYERNGFELSHYHESMAFYEKALKVVVGIHQPNFLPWLGFFHKIAASDKFVILDHVTNRPNDAIYTKRVTIVCNSQEYWLTVPIRKLKGQEFVPINEMVITDDGFDKKHLRTVEMNYKKAPFYKAFFYLFEDFYNHPSPLIAERNIDFIKQVCRILNITTPLYRSSANQVSSASNELLIDLIKAVNGNVYLHGSYAVSEKGYQNNDAFLQNGIDLLPQKFRHPVYPQHNNKGGFIAGTSIMDALMNVGPENVKAMLSEESSHQLSLAN